MSAWGRKACLAFAWLCLLVGLPIAGHLARQSRKPRCAFDGQPIERIYKVRVVIGQDVEKDFCCILCAEHWLRASRATPANISVTDEVTGKEIDETDAFFVRSVVVTNPVTGNRVHVFRRIEDALEHAQEAPGTLLEGDERPFRYAPFSSHQETRDGE